MRVEGDLIKINKWLLPLSWIYGMVVMLRNKLFDWGILPSKAFRVPVISVGNITVGGSGKTPHVEYLIKLLSGKQQVAILSRGYKRKSHGYILANDASTAEEIGDEPFQMKSKFAGVHVAVDKNRRHGIKRLTTDEGTANTDVILLDDAFQHRYVKPGINILLVDYHRLIIYDKLLPAGRLREPLSGKSRADVVIITKCPSDLKPMEFRVLTKAMDLYPYQSLYFTTLQYGKLKPFVKGNDMPLEALRNFDEVLLVTGIASPQHLLDDVQKINKHITHLSFPDHHAFKPRDVKRMETAFGAMKGKKVVVTTEKDAARLKDVAAFDADFQSALYILPVEVKFMLDQEELFNQKIISYVRKNSRNSILVKTKNDHKSKDRHHSGNGTGTISFRNN